jgi:hypothetical protein
MLTVIAESKKKGTAVLMKRVADIVDSTKINQKNDVGAFLYFN